MKAVAASSAHEYDRLFYEYQREGSLRSAHALLPLVVDALHPTSVLDVGCGAGAWLSAYGKLGVADIAGVDGDYVDRSVLLIEQAAFHPRDITKAFDFGRQFDLVQCLEVAEHVPPEASGMLLDNITRHGTVVLFSAAVPGQGGEDHINEQTYAYWRDQFAARGYRLFDFVRPLVAGHEAIEPWYRYNVLLFAHDRVIGLLPEAVRRSAIPDRMTIPDYSPVAYRLRKAVLKLLHPSLVTWLAVRKHKRFVANLGS